MSTSDKMELSQLLDEIAKKGFQTIGIIFYDSKTKLLGIAPLSGVPDAFVERIGQRLSGMKEGGTSWHSIAEA
jgi:hypothetical protein